MKFILKRANLRGRNGVNLGAARFDLSIWVNLFIFAVQIITMILPT